MYEPRFKLSMYEDLFAILLRMVAMGIDDRTPVDIVINSQGNTGSFGYCLVFKTPLGIVGKHP